MCPVSGRSSCHSVKSLAFAHRRDVTCCERGPTLDLGVGPAFVPGVETQYLASGCVQGVCGWPITTAFCQRPGCDRVADVDSVDERAVGGPFQAVQGEVTPLLETRNRTFW